MTNVVQFVRDGMRNVLSGLGTHNDKGASNRHYLEFPSDSELTTAYEMSWIARAMVDMPAVDATKHWRTWSGKSAEKLQHEDARLEIRAKAAQAIKSARLYGGAVIYIGVGDDDPSQPLDHRSVREIQFITALDRFDMTAGRVVRDIASPRFNKPENYTATVNGKTRTVHPSRLCEFGASKPASYTYGSAIQGWDNSILVSKMEAVRAIDGVMASLSSLVAEAKIDVIKSPELTNRVQDPRYEAALMAQLQLAEKAIGNRRKMLLDAEEDFVTSTYAFAGMSDVVDRFMQMAAGAAEIPSTRLFGESPGGLNSTGESDLSNYDAGLQSMQSNIITPALKPLDDCMRAVAGDLEGDFTWNPVREPTGKALADMQKATVDSITGLAATQLYEDDDMVEIAGPMLTRVKIKAPERNFSD